ncbi:MAG: hypothetical protein ABIS07_05385 [Dokdonella sp.]
MTTPLQPADLLPGDVLLHMGAGELSKLIAWSGDSAYSHAAMVIAGGQLIEAAAAGVRHARLGDRTHMLANFNFIDVFRPLKPIAADTAGFAAVLAAAEVYLGRPYPMTSLLTLGVVCAVRNKMPGDPKLRQALRMAFDLVIDNDANQVVCSELVYRAYDEAATKPAHALRLLLDTQRSAGSVKLPPIDLQVLLAECIDDYNRSRQNTVPKTLTAAADDRDLDELLAMARTSLGVDVMPRSASGDYAPNPKTILPADLEFSPGLRKIGRLALSR